MEVTDQVRSFVELFSRASVRSMPLPNTLV
jgi:hypothetical protein